MAAQGGPAGSPVTSLGVDTSGFDRQIDAVVNRFQRMSANIRTAAAASATFNAAGRLTDLVIQSIGNSGNVLISNLQRQGRTWTQTTEIVTKSVSAQLREQERLRAAADKAAEQGRRFQETTAFRPRLDAEARLLPQGNAIDQRFFTNAQRDLEKFVIAGSVTSARANQILDDMQNGVKTRLQGVEEDFRVAALRMFKQQQNLIRTATAATNLNTQTQQSTQVPNTVDRLFGPINPAASAAMISSVRATMNQMANTVQSGGVAFDRFGELVQGALLGFVNPANKAERAVVKMVQEMQRQYAAAATAANNLTAAQQREAAAAQLGADLRARMGKLYTNLKTQDRERVDAQINRLQDLTRRTNNPLTGAGATRAIDAGLSGASGAGFTGVDAQARKAAARIRGILRQELKDPFQIQLAISQNFNFVKSLYTGQFLTRLVQDFEQVVSAAAGYQRSIALIQTITDDVKVPFDTWSESIRKVSDELGKPIADVAAAGYDVLSNQVTKYVEDTQSVLTTAGEFATVTNSTVEDSVNLLSSAINTFKLGSSDAERVAAQFFTTIDLGRVKTNEMANTIGRSAVFAKTLGVSLEELQAGIITITQTGQKADSSFTLLNNVFQKLLNPTKELQEYYDRLGVSTGDVFIKTFGFTGALQKLQEETKGSASKLSDFFNEIRAFGGIDALISRADVFEDALKQLGNSSETLDAAKKKFENLPGQKFLIEMNKAKNLFLTTFQTSILTNIVRYSEAFGGLANVIKVATIAAASLGVTLGVAFMAFKIDGWIKALGLGQSAMSALTGSTLAFGAASTLAFGGAVVAVSALAVVAYAYYNKSLQYYDDLKSASDKAAADEINSNNKMSAERLKAFTDGLKGQQQELLKFQAINTQVLQKRVADEEAASKKIAASLKNAFENGFGTARNILDELQGKQRELLKSAEDFKKTGRQTIIDKFKDTKFQRDLAENEASGGGNRNEAAIFARRLREVTKTAMDAAKRGDRDSMRSAFDERDNLVKQIADKDRELQKRSRETGAPQDRSFAFANTDDFDLKSAQLRLALEKQITKEQQKQGIALQAPINNMADKLKALEDAQKELSDFKLTDNGKPIDAGKDQALDRLMKLRNEVVRLITEITQQAGPGDKFLQRDLFSKQNELAMARVAELRVSIGKQFDAQNALKEQGEIVNKAIDALGEGAASRMKVAEEKFTSASNILAQSVKDTETQLKNVFTRGLFPQENFGAPDPKLDKGNLPPENIQRVELQGQITQAIKGQDYDLAIRKLDELNKLLEQNKLLQQKVPEAGGGKVAVGDVLAKAREGLLNAQDAQGKQATAKQAMDAAKQNVTGIEGAIQRLNDSYRALGGTDEAIAAKLIANQGLAATAFQNSKTVVDQLAASIQKLGVTEAQRNAAALAVKNNDFTRPGAVVSPDGTIQQTGPGFQAQPRQLNNFGGPQNEGPRTSNVNITVNVDAPPKEEQLGAKVANEIIRQLRRDPQVLERAK